MDKPKQHLVAVSEDEIGPHYGELNCPTVYWSNGNYAYVDADELRLCGRRRTPRVARITKYIRCE